MAAFKSLLIVGLLALAALSSQIDEQKYLGNQATHDDYERFIPFGVFLNGVRQAEYEDYEDCKVKDEEAFIEMQEHILKMYGGVVSRVTSFVSENEYSDCIAIMEQPTVHLLGIRDIPQPPGNSSHNQTAEGPAPGNFSRAESPLKLALKDRFINTISCPKHAIPMTRLTLEKLTRFSTLQDFFSKPPAPARGREPDFSAQEVHEHAYGIQQVTNFGGNSWLDLWNPVGDFSISQHWYVGNETGQPEQTVEGGWIMDTYDNPDMTKSVLFIYYTADGYNTLKCWNLQCAAFVQLNHNWYLGGPWNHYSTTDGGQWGFEMQWKLYQGNWWLFLKGPGEYEVVGYYNDTIYNGGQLARNATDIIYGGEVANYTGGADLPQMGSGAFAQKGWREAAFQNTIFWIPRDEDDGVGVWANLTAIDEGKPSCYTIQLVDWPNGGDWGTYFYFGGPRGNGC